MKISGEQLRRLAALNLPGEAFQQVLAIIADISSNDDARLERQRLRRAKYPRHKDGPRDGPRDGHSDESWDGQRDAPPRIYTSPPKESSEPKKVLRSICATALPTTWTLDEQDRVYARTKGWPESKIESEAERFKDHALDKGRKAKNWHAAWRNWVTSPFQKNGNGATSGHTPRPGSREDRAEKTANAYAKLREFSEAGTSKRGSGGPAGEAPFRLLPIAKPT